jgi:Reverse transcriptase (RNA-dependent DNA polymerase)
VFLIHQTVNEANISRGCPQGSVLSPYLWNLLADDVFSIEIRGFADDISIACSSGSVASISNALQNACNAITAWRTARCLTFSDQKSEPIFFSRKRSADSTINVSINNTPIQTQQKVKGLSNSYALSHTRPGGLSHNKLKFMYDTIVSPILTYAAPIWVSELSST